jgi:hypothetical protein
MLRKVLVLVAASLAVLSAAGVAYADDDDAVNCELIVPASPLSAAGLMTPYQLTGKKCRESNLNTSAFVEATIFNPATSRLSIYRPVVVDRGDDPAAAPVSVTLPANAVVGVWFGFQGQNLTLRGDTAGCVNGLGRSVFGQFAYCGAREFFTATHSAIGAGRLKIPPLGVARDGKPCPTTRDFAIVDQDQSDNLDTQYRVVHGRIAQDTGQGDGRVLSNASDNGLLNQFIDPAIGCRPFTAPDLTAGGRPSPSLALNELQAEFQQAPTALVPPNDPMTLRGDNRSDEKTNLYRAGTGQPLLAGDNSRGYCDSLRAVAPDRLKGWEKFTRDAPSPDKATGKNLEQFLRNRLKATVKNLKCGKGSDHSG